MSKRVRNDKARERVHHGERCVTSWSMSCGSHRELISISTPSLRMPGSSCQLAGATGRS